MTQILSNSFEDMDVDLVAQLKTGSLEPNKASQKQNQTQLV